MRPDLCLQLARVEFTRFSGDKTEGAGHMARRAAQSLKDPA